MAPKNSPPLSSTVMNTISGARHSVSHEYDVASVDAVVPIDLVPNENGGGIQDESTCDAAGGMAGKVTMDLNRAHTFDPAEDHISSFSRLRSLDMLPAMGLTEDEFWSVFSRCRACSNFMTTRTIPYHVCPTEDSKAQLDRSVIKKVHFPRLLDAHDSDFSMGVPYDVFQAIFYICADCGRYMTRRLSFYHHDDDDYESPLSPCVYLRKDVVSSLSTKRDKPLQGFPPLSPLYDNH